MHLETVADVFAVLIAEHGTPNTGLSGRAGLIDRDKRHGDASSPWFSMAGGDAGMPHPVDADEPLVCGCCGQPKAWYVDGDRWDFVCGCTPF